jgi:hypothetical protein
MERCSPRNSELYKLAMKVCTLFVRQKQASKMSIFYLTKTKELSTKDGMQKMKMTVDTCVRLVRPGIARMAWDDGKVCIYHLLHNSREHQAQPLSPIEYEIDGKIFFLLHSRYCFMFCTHVFVKMPLASLCCLDRILTTSGMYYYLR